jgi:hypothetical protein
MRSEEKLNELEINRVKYNYMKNKNKILKEINGMMNNLSKTTIQDMETKFNKQFEQEEIESYVRGIIKRDWYDLQELLF